MTEGIRFGIENDYGNPGVLDRFIEQVRTAREEIGKFIAAQNARAAASRRGGSNQGARAAASEERRSRAVERGAQAEGRRTAAVERGTRAERQKVKLQNDATNAVFRELLAKQRSLRVSQIENRLNERTLRGNRALVNTKQAQVRQTQAQLRLASLEQDENASALDILRATNEAESQRLRQQEIGNRLARQNGREDALRRQVSLEGQLTERSQARAQIIGRNLNTTAQRVTLARQLLNIDRARAALSGGGLTPLQEERERLNLRQAGVRINGLLAQSERETSRAQREGGRETRRSNSLLQNLGGTVRGVVAGLVIYRGVTRSIAAILAGITTGVSFGNELEIQQRAIAGIIAGQAAIATNGEVLTTNQERFNTALRISDSLITQLRSDALDSTATLRDLTSNFQLNVAQGLNAGLSLDEFRDVAQAFSEAGSLLGLQQNQLAEEIRSVLTGSIRTRDTRIAVALNITNEDVRLAREQGELAGFLEERFQGIRTAVDELSGTLPILQTRIVDAFQIAAADGAAPFREELRLLAQDLFDVISGGGGTINSDFQNIVGDVFEPLAGVASDVRVLLPEILAGLAQITSLGVNLIGTFTSLFSIFSPFLNLFVGFVSGLNDALQVVTGLTRALRDLFDDTAFAGTIRFLSNGLSGLIASLGAFAGTAAAVAGILFTGRGLIVGVGLLTTALGKLRTILAGTGAVAALFNLPFVLTVAVIGLIVAAIDVLLSKVEEIPQAIGRTLDALAGQSGAEERILELQKELSGIQFSLSIGETIGEDVQEALKRVQELEAEIENLRNGGPVSLGDQVSEFLNTGVLKNLSDSLTSSIDNALSAAELRFAAAGNVQSLLIADQVQQQFRLNQLTSQYEKARASLVQVEGGLAQSLDAQLDLIRQQIEQQDALVRRRRELQDANTRVTDPNQRALNDAQIDIINEDLARSSQQFSQELRRQIELIEARTRAQREFQIGEATIAAAESQALANIDLAAPFAQQAQAVIGTRAEIAQLTLESQTLDAQIQAVSRSISQLDGSASGASGVRVKGSEALLALEQDTLQQLEAQQSVVAGTLALRRQELGLQEGSLNRQTGVDSAFTSVNEDLSRASIAEREISEYVSSLRGAISQGISVGLARGDVNAVIISLGNSLATTFINRLVEDVLLRNLFSAFGQSANPVASAGQGIASDLAGRAGTQAAGDAVGALGEAAQNAAPSIAQSGAEAAAQAVVTGAASSNTAGLAGALGPAIIAINAFTAALAEAAASGFLTSATGNAQGGLIGFDDGGRVWGTNSGPSVPGFDPRDRVRALLRRGEYVATPEMNSRTGGMLYPFLERLRQGVHNLPSLSTLSHSAKKRLGVRGMATGGGIGSSVSPGGSLVAAGGASYVPVMAVGNRESRRMLAQPALLQTMTERREDVNRSLRSRGVSDAR